MKKTFYLLFALLINYANSAELPLTQWAKSGPNDIIANHILTLEKKAGDLRRPEIYQHTKFKPGETYEISFTERSEIAGIALQLHIDFENGKGCKRFKPLIFNTIWHNYKYTFKAGGQKARITFLISTRPNIPFKTEIKNIIIKEAGELFDPPDYIKNTETKTILGTYNIIPENVYHIKLNFNHHKNWQIRFLGFDENKIGQFSGKSCTLNKEFKFPLRTVSLQLILSKTSPEELKQVSLRKVEN